MRSDWVASLIPWHYYFTLAKSWVRVRSVPKVKAELIGHSIFTSKVCLIVILMCFHIQESFCSWYVGCLLYSIIHLRKHTKSKCVCAYPLLLMPFDVVLNQLLKITHISHSWNSCTLEKMDILCALIVITYCAGEWEYRCRWIFEDFICAMA